jgi:hypothetical protein
MAQADESPQGAPRNKTFSRYNTVATYAVVFAIAAVCLLTNEKTGTAAFRALDMRANASDWVRLQDSTPTLALNQAPYAGQAQQHTTFVHPDGSRSDWALFGTLGDTAPNATIQIVRRAQPLPNRNSLLQNLEQLHEIKAAQRRFGFDYYVLGTRFGDLRAVSFMVVADGVHKSCLGFHQAGSGRLFVKGFVCSPEPAQVAPQRVACLIDQVRFTRAADEEGLKAFRGEQDPRECAAAPLTPQPSGTTARDNTL